MNNEKQEEKKKDFTEMLRQFKLNRELNGKENQI